MRKEDKNENRKGTPQVAGEGIWCFALSLPFSQSLNQMRAQWWTPSRLRNQQTAWRQIRGSRCYVLESEKAAGRDFMRNRSCRRHILNWTLM